jgi:hypothetical protein
MAWVSDQLTALLPMLHLLLPLLLHLTLPLLQLLPRLQQQLGSYPGCLRCLLVPLLVHLQQLLRQLSHPLLFGRWPWTGRYCRLRGREPTAAAPLQWQMQAFWVLPCLQHFRCASTSKSDKVKGRSVGKVCSQHTVQRCCMPLGTPAHVCRTHRQS